jgi:hypothetical protein
LFLGNGSEEDDMDKGKTPQGKAEKPKPEDAAKTATNEAERHMTGEIPAKTAAQKQ